MYDPNDDEEKMRAAQKRQNLSLGVNAATTATEIGLSAYGAHEDAKRRARREKEAAILAGTQAMGGAGGSKADLEDRAIKNLMRIGR